MDLRPGPLALRARHALRDAQAQAVAAFVNVDPVDNLYVFCDPRGGGTWLTEAIAEVPRTAVMWEPLLERQMPEWTHLGLGPRPALPEGADRPETRAVLDRVFRGKALNRWSKGSDALTCVRADRLLIKVSRGNALLPWLTKQFPFRRPPVLLVRHPFAVVASQLAWGAWSSLHDRANQDRTPEEALVQTWCTTTLQALRHERCGTDWVPVFYEHLLQDPEREVERIFGRWEIRVPPSIYGRMGRASATTKEATFEDGAEAQLSKWQRALSPDQVARMRAVLEQYDVTEYGLSPLPTVALPA